MQGVWVNILCTMRGQTFAVVVRFKDTIIEAIYSDIIRGKLDHMASQLQVHYTIARDVPPQQMPHMTGVLEEWSVFNVVRV